MQWFKFYGGEYLSDPKVSSLTPQERSCWITLLCLSSVSSDDGTVEFLTIEVLLTKSGINFDPYHPEEWDKCLVVLEKLERLKMIKRHDTGTIEILNWKKRQESFLTGAERQAKYRQNKKSDEIVTERVTNVTLDKTRLDKTRKEGATPAQEARDLFSGKGVEEFLEFFASRSNAPPDVLSAELVKFASYWTEKNKLGTKQRWEQQKTFEVKRRFVTWMGNFSNYSKVEKTGRGLA